MWKFLHTYTQNRVTLTFTLCKPVLVSKCNSCVGCKLCHVRNASVSRSGLSLKTGIFNPSLPRDIWQRHAFLLLIFSHSCWHFDIFFFGAFLHVCRFENSCRLLPARFSSVFLWNTDSIVSKSNNLINVSSQGRPNDKGRGGADRSQRHKS